MPRTTPLRSWLLSGALVVAVCVAAVLLASQGRGDATDIAAPKAVSSTLAGIPQDGDTLGSPKAPNVLVLYADTDCVGCGDVYWGILPRLVDRDVRAGRLRIIVRPVTTPGAPAVGIREAFAAGMQDKMFDYLLAFDLLKAQGTDPLNVARAVGVDLDRLRADSASADADVQVEQAEDRARRLKAAPPAMYFDPAGSGPADARQVPLTDPAAVTVAELERQLSRSR